MMADRFIKLYDKILKWEWYKNTNTKVLFLHLLLRANYKDLSLEGHKILRGQLVTSLPSLASETGLTQRQVRVSLEKLIMTGEVSSKAYPRYRVITIVHYDDYQSDVRQNGRQMTGEMSDKRQADDRLVTGSRQARDRLVTASIDNIEQIDKIDKVEQIDKSMGKTAQRFTPPTKQEIDIFCLENGLSIDVDYFFDYYTANGWLVGKNKMKDWQATVRNWARRDQGSGSRAIPAAKPKPAPVKPSSAHNFDERDYSNVDKAMMDDLESWVAREREAGNL
jgi:hypothetical protein